MKMWVDPTQGYLYGFPKVYDPDKDEPIKYWLVQNGLPLKYLDFPMRQWSAEEDITNENPNQSS